MLVRYCGSYMKWAGKKKCLQITKEKSCKDDIVTMKKENVFKSVEQGLGL